MNTILKDKWNEMLHVNTLIIARADVADVVAGTVYPANINYPEAGEATLIDGANELCILESHEYEVFNEKSIFCKVNEAFTRAGFKQGDIVPTKTALPGKAINPGCVWCLNRRGEYIALNKKNLSIVKPKYSAQALTAKLKSSAEAVGRVVEINGAATGGQGTCFVIYFKPTEVTHDNVVRVEFTRGGKRYTYRLKDGMIAQPGDDAVVVVNNPNYPELKGTKVVKVMEVDQVENLGGSYKYVEHIVCNENERRAKREAERKADQKAIDNKRHELSAANQRANRIALELDKLELDFKAKYF